MRPRRGAGIPPAFEPSSYVHAVTENVAVLSDDIANVDAYPEVDAFLGGNLRITLGHDGLNLGRTPQGIDDTAELDQQTVTGSFDYATSDVR